MIDITTSEGVELYERQISANIEHSWTIDRVGPSDYNIEAPNHMLFYVRNGHIDWNEIPAQQEQTVWLWKYSLLWIKIIYRDHHDTSTVDNLLIDFCEFYETDSAQQTLAKMYSRDHCTAEIIRTVVLAMVAWKVSEKAIVCLNSLLHSVASWSLRPGSIAINNHGLMLSIAMLHARLAATVELKTSIGDYPETMLCKILEGSFDSTGLCVENTPAYQYMWIKYFNLLQDQFALLSDNQDFLTLLESTLEKAVSTLKVSLWPGNIFPPIGDGNSELCSLQGEPGELFSPDSGFYVHKTDKNYFSMSCGSSSFVHKHMDDTSITLVINEVPLILDAGLYTYDWNDPFCRLAKTQRGHSGAFFLAFDDVYPAQVYRHDSDRSHASLDLGTSLEGQRFLRGKHTLDGKFTTTRDLVFDPKKYSLYIEDTFSVNGPTTDKAWNAVSRFLFPGNADISVSGQGFTIRADGEEAAISILTGHGFRLQRGIISDLPTGWRATGFGVIEPAWCVEIEPDEESGVVTLRVETSAS